MTMILELPAELEARLKADARARGVAPEIVVVEAVSARYGESKSERLKRIRAARGSLKRATGEHGYGVAGFLAEKRADIERDEAKL